MLPLPFHHWEPATLILVTPEHLSRLLKEMERSGMIRRDRDSITGLDVCRLSTWGDDEWAWPDGS
jgi:hypothetical protein